MAILPDYTSGVISLANGSVRVTGTGTMFTAAAFKAGDTLLIQNLTAVIASVDSNTKLTLAVPWTGTTITNAPYRARYLPDGARVTARTTALIELLGNGVLSSIAELPTTKDTLAFFTGAGTADLTPFTPYARTLLDDANASAARNTLELSGNGIATLALENYGNYGSATSGINVNELPIGTRGLYATQLVGSPTYAGVPFWHIETQRVYIGDAKVQTAIAYNPGGVEPIVAVRSFGATAGAYSPWRFLISEKGSNANGEFARFPDGTQICRTNTASALRGGNDFANGSWTFPAPFNNNPIVLKSSFHTGTANYTGSITQTSVGITTRQGETVNTSVGFAVWRSAGAPLFTVGSQITNISLEVTGRWF